MRPTREKAQENRQRIVDTASKLFREKGIHAVGVDAIMKGAGLTHGGFYGHFKSKDELANEALGHCMSGRLATETPVASRSEFVDAYLSTAHRDNAADGCAMAALGAEMARLDHGSRGDVSTYVRYRIAQLMLLPDADGRLPTRTEAIASLSSLIGALVIARAVDDLDLSDEILDATAAMAATSGASAAR